MPSEPLWLDDQAVIEINRYLVGRTGERHALLFPDRLAGAVLRPRNAFFYEKNSNTLSLSVNLMVAIGQAHAFEQGNKRTAFASGIAFLNDNGYDLRHPDGEELGMMLEAVILRQTAPAALEAMLAPWIILCE
ncbi:type II toxin-antitoxin system death-on-curing family toxin [Peteryoungia desertarenae]|uniref:Type II toxin-antitoxin system death-on-curing family toxin n=1 Tax=Peteryoungia desertarenae TaxID=1813451 RepID=A0ABX6QN86_9HYPH|nr:type II toxin-antitoxin system death-on-curing family toxin [Peteryoungia desertarenae]QLF69707.1 type II toxin-antitoxin system death-on-curing family toxin [Peteryoungia desertarenae]